MLKLAEPLTTDTKFLFIVLDWLYPFEPKSVASDADTTSILCDVDEPLIEKYSLSVSLKFFFLTLYDNVYSEPLTKSIDSDVWIKPSLAKNIEFINLSLSNETVLECDTKKLATLNDVKFPYSIIVSDVFVTFLNNSADSNFVSWINWKSPNSFLDFLNIFTRATSPVNVFKSVILISANEPVNEVSPNTWSSFASNVTLYGASWKLDTNPLLVNGISTNKSVGVRTSFILGLYPKLGIDIMVSSILWLNPGWDGLSVSNFTL